MEGPTPVSALIHAATMVTAGVFLIIRCSPIFEYTPSVLTFITCVGALTAFFAASIGLVQNDIKKIIAYSTMSQLARKCNIYLITLRHQTICVKLIFKNLYEILNMINSQITKAHGYLLNSHISYNLLNSLLIN
jgi:NADH:ubiquinone oxidoreductase subunit 4 (subunit M)